MKSSARLLLLSIILTLVVLLVVPELFKKQIIDNFVDNYLDNNREPLIINCLMYGSMTKENFYIVTIFFCVTMNTDAPK